MLPTRLTLIAPLSLTISIAIAIPIATSVAKRWRRAALALTSRQSRAKTLAIWHLLGHCLRQGLLVSVRLGIGHLGCLLLLAGHVTGHMHPLGDLDLSVVLRVAPDISAIVTLLCNLLKIIEIN